MSTHEGLWPLCETCGAVPTSHKGYDDCAAHMQVVAQAYNGGSENGSRQERAAVVAYLRMLASYGGLRGSVCGAAANCIERGEHRREEKKE